MFRRGCLLGAVLFVLAAIGCSKAPPAPVAGPPGTPGSAPVAATGSGPDETPLDRPDPGTPLEGPAGHIDGTVTYAGSDLPKPTIVTNGTDPLVCGAQVSKQDIEISPDTRGVRYVLAWLEGVSLPDGYKPPQQNLILDNVKCQFEPHAAAITVGSIIETRNSDDVYHTTNLFGKLTKENIPLVSKGVTHRTIARHAEMIGVKCDKHGWMQAYVRVDPHPFHAVTDSDGKFRIADVPVGTYKLKLWHETFGSQELDAAVRDGETTALQVKYPVDP